MSTFVKVKNESPKGSEPTSGITVGELRKIVLMAEAESCPEVLPELGLATVHRKLEKDKLIGNVDPYVLKDGDIVEFKDDARSQYRKLEAVCDQLIREVMESMKSEASKPQCTATCPNHGTCASAPEEKEQVLCNSGNLKITEFPGGLRIQIRG